MNEKQPNIANTSTEAWWAAELDDQPWQVRTTIVVHHGTLKTATGEVPWKESDVHVEIVNPEHGTTLPFWAMTGLSTTAPRKIETLQVAEADAIRIAKQLAAYERTITKPAQRKTAQEQK